MSLMIVSCFETIKLFDAFFFSTADSKCNRDEECIDANIFQINQAE